MGNSRGSHNSSDVVRTGAELVQQNEQDQEIAQQLVARAREEGVNLVGENSLFKGLLKLVLEGALESEMSEHLGYEKGDPAGRGAVNSRNGTTSKRLRTEVGEVDIDVPRDRNGMFEPQIVPKHQRKIEGFDEAVLSLYAKGLTTGEIQQHLAEIYDMDVSRGLISRATDKIKDEVDAWRNRPLDKIYAVLMIDAIVLKIRDGAVSNRPVYIAVGINLEGERDVLGMWVGTGGEGAKHWMTWLSELRNRGVQDVLISCCDGLKGLPDSLTSIWPQTDVQLCVVHSEAVKEQPVALIGQVRCSGMSFADDVLDQLTLRFQVLLPHLNERQRRLMLAQEARLLGHGGVRAVARVAGVSETTVRNGVFELEAGEDPLPDGRVRRPGGGRRPAEEDDPSLVPALLKLVEPDERGDPMSPLRWTTKSLRNLAEELTRQGHPVSAPTVGRLLKKQGFSLQASAKTLEGKQHPGRDAQFRYINKQVKEHQAAGEPVISIDAKKKEQLGQLPNPGRQWRPAGDPVQVEDHSFYFLGPDVEVAIPFGIYDLAHDSGWVNVGTDHDTSVFAVESIRRWWQARGRVDYPDANRLLITADCGGSNSYRYRLWKAELATFAAQTGLTVTVCHFPPGTSKWNKIEHRLFSHITMNWRGRPLTSHDVVVNSIAATRTRTGLRVHAELDPATYPVGISVSREHLRSLPITPHDQHGSWNYTIAPSTSTGEPAITVSDREHTRSKALAMLAQPHLSGMTAPELDELCALLAPAQAAQAEQRKFQQRGGRRLQAPGAHGKPLLSNADRILITVIYLRRVCPQRVLVDLLAINPVTIGTTIRETRTLMDAQKITVSQTAHYFSSARELRDWAEGGATTSRMDLSQTLTHPALTGMPRTDFQALIDRITVPYQAALERRRHRQRGGDRRPGTRGGVFRQKITDADRILATVLSQRDLCDQQTLADLFGVSRGTIRNAIKDVLPLLEQDTYLPARAERRFHTANDVLASVTGDREPPR